MPQKYYTCPATQADAGAARIPPGRSQKMKQYASTQRRTVYEPNKDQVREAINLAGARPALANKIHR